MLIIVIDINQEPEFDKKILESQIENLNSKNGLFFDAGAYKRFKKGQAEEDKDNTEDIIGGYIGVSWNLLSNGLASYKNQADILEYDLKVMEIMNRLTKVKDKSEMIISSIIKIFNREKLKVLEYLEESEKKKLEILRYSYFLRSTTKII